MLLDEAVGRSNQVRIKWLSGISHCSHIRTPSDWSSIQTPETGFAGFFPCQL